MPLVTLGLEDGDQGEIGGDSVTRAHVELGERAQAEGHRKWFQRLEQEPEASRHGKDRCFDFVPVRMCAAALTMGH